MIKTITRYDFEDAFNKSDTCKNNFSYEGKKALFQYLENYQNGHVSGVLKKQFRQ